jgi:Putative beta-barrel porin 2
VRLSAQTPLSRLTLEPSLDLTRFVFGSATIGGVPAPQAYRDRLVAEAGLRVSYGVEGYEDPDRLQLTVEPVVGHYPNQSLGEPPRDFVGGTVLLGVEHDLDGLWGWRIEAGAGGRIYRDPYEDQLVPLVDAAVTWQPNERTTWHAALFRQIEAAADEGVGGYVATIGGVAMDRELRRDLILHLGADLDRADFVGSSETFVTGRLSLQWLISPVLRARATVTLTDHQSTTATPYGENLFMLSMTAGL